MTAALGLVADRLDGVQSGPALARQQSVAARDGPMDLACSLNPRLVRTPALDLLSAELERAITTPGTRLLVSFSPQEGKTSSVRYGVLRSLQINPERRVAITSYAADLARTSSLAIRQMIEVFGSNAIDPATGLPMPDRLGLAIAPDQGAAGGWRLRGHEGGVIARGVGSGLTGRPVDLLVCDDPIKDARDADSDLIRARLHDWWSAVSETRLSPEASAIVVATRWHEQDLSGWLVEQDEQLPEGEREWRVVNIPALADGKTADALGRPAGEWMLSARGRTVPQWEAIRRRVGERVFAGLYQGRPAPLAGGVFLQEWFDRDRVTERPADCLPPTVYCDPADNTGGGDEAGILVGCVDTQRRIYLGPDYTLLATTGRWVRVALLACVRHHASALAYEKSLSGLARAVRDGWALLRKQARVLRRHGSDNWTGPPDEQVIAAALAEVTHPDDPDTTTAETRDQLIELWPMVPAVLAYPEGGPRIKVIQPKGSKLFRMQTAAPMFENRRVSLIGQLPELEHEATTWQPTQASPNRVDAMVYAVHDLSGASPATLGRSTDSIPTTSARSARGSGQADRLTRSTRR